MVEWGTRWFLGGPTRGRVGFLTLFLLFPKNNTPRGCKTHTHTQKNYVVIIGSITRDYFIDLLGNKRFITQFIRIYSHLKSRPNRGFVIPNYLNEPHFLEPPSSSSDFRLSHISTPFQFPLFLFLYLKFKFDGCVR